MDNKAQIDLIANPDKFNKGLVAAGASADKFAAQSAASMTKADKAAKTLTADTNSLGAAAIKNAPAILAFAFSFTKVATNAWLAQTAVEALGYAAETSGKSIKVMDDSLEISKKILQEVGHDVEKLNGLLDELGVTAEQIGLKVENNLTRIQDSLSKATKSALKDFHQSSDDFAQEGRRISAVLDHETKQWHEAFVAPFVAIGKSLENAGKDIHEMFRYIGGDIAGFSVQETTAALELEKKLEAIAKSNKIAAIRKEMTQKERDIYTKHYQDLQDIARDNTREEEIAQVKNLTNIAKIIEANHAEAQSMILMGKTGTKEYADLIKSTDLFLQRQTELNATLKATQKAMTESIGAKPEREAEREKQLRREAQADAVANANQLRDLLKEQEEETMRLKTIQDDASDEHFRKVEESMRRQEALRRAIVVAEDRERQKKLDEDLLAVEKVRIAKLRTRDIERSIEDEQRRTEQDKAMRTLELQGATANKLHELKMQFIDDEEKKAMSRIEVAGNPEEIERIKAESRKRRIQEVAAFQEQVDRDQAEVKKVQVEEFRRVEEETFLKKKNSERDLHEWNMKRLKEEAELADKNATTEADHLRIQFELQRKIKEEKARFEAIKKEGVDVDQKANSAPRFISRDEMRQRTREGRKAQKDNAKKLAQSRKEAVAKKKQDAFEARQKKTAPIKAHRDKQKEQAAIKVKGNQKQLADVLEGFKATKDQIQDMALKKADNKLLQVIATSLARMEQYTEKTASSIRTLVGN